jgi:RimK family alpha-L-glutamate ligase
MRVLILSARAGWHTDELCRALAARGHHARLAPYESLVARIGGASDSVFDVDAVLARIIPNGSLEQVIYRVDALHWIEDKGIRVVNSARAIERAVDKFYTTALMHQAGLPVPETVVCERADDAMDAIRRMLAGGAEVIIKPIFGSMGHGLVRVGDVDVAWRVVRPLEQMRSVFYVQRAIEHGGRDIRLFVVGPRVVGAIERIAPDGDWRTNVARGGTARPIDVSPRWHDYAIRAAAIIGADYAGVDIIESHSGESFVLEVNGIPGWQGLQTATGVDVATGIVELIENLVSRGQLAAEEAHA